VTNAPAAFVSHGSPMVAIDTPDAYTDAIADLGRRNRPRALAVVSAHWTTSGGAAIAAGERPRVIHDFGGFPEALYRLEYPAHGDPALSVEIAARLGAAGIPARLDPSHGIDHGTWIPLRIAWPDGAIPVVQVSLPEMGPRDLFRMGEALRPLRDEGVLVLGSGGMVHNLRELDWEHKYAPPEPWAQAFDAWMAAHLEAGDVEALLDWRERAPSARRAAPTTEHLDPLFVALGAAGGNRPTTIFEGFHHGSLGMRSLEFRAA
jgi:4,5-DOPA dioxygenase extradiol